MVSVPFGFVVFSCCLPSQELKRSAAKAVTDASRIVLSLVCGVFLMIDPCFMVVLGFSRYQFVQFLKLHPPMQENKPKTNLFPNFLGWHRIYTRKVPRSCPVDHAQKTARGYHPAAGHILYASKGAVSKSQGNMFFESSIFFPLAKSFRYAILLMR